MPADASSIDLASPDAVRTILASVDPAEFTRIFWDGTLRESGWDNCCRPVLAPLITAMARALPGDLNHTEHPYWRLLEHLHPLLIGHQSDLGRAGARALDTIHAALAESIDAGWAGCADAIAALGHQEQGRQQRIEQRLLDIAQGQIRSQRARQQAAQLLNRSMAGRQLPPNVVEWLQGDWFGELQWCLLQHGDTSAAWQTRAAATLDLVASLQPPTDDSGGRQALYALIPRVSAALREILTTRAVSAAEADNVLAGIEQHHLELLKGHKPATAAFRLIATEGTWYADLSLSREMLARTEALRPGDWFMLREDAGDRRIKLILKQDEAGQLLFVNQLGIKALEISVEEFSYRLSTEMAVALPLVNGGRQALLETLDLFAARLRGAEQARQQEAEALQRRREEVRERVEAEARRRAQARAKATAEARALAEARARAEAEAAREAEAAQQRAREREHTRRREAQARQRGDETQRQRAARQQVAGLAIGQWIELHDDTGHLQRLKLAVKLPASDKLIFVDREGIRRAEFNREQLVGALLDGSATVTTQGPHFEDTLARVVDGLRRDRRQDRNDRE